MSDGEGGDGAAEGVDEHGRLHPPETILCVDCGGRCHLLSHYERDEYGGAIGFSEGDIVAYRCEDCLDRWDIELG